MNKLRSFLPLCIIFISITILFSQAKAQDRWKFKKEKDNILAKNLTTGKEAVIFRGGNTTTVEEGDTTSTDINYSIVSYVGPYVTVLKSYYSFTTGAAHDGRERTFEVIDASSGRPAKLTDIFKESDVLNALLQDGYIKKALADGAHPKTLAELSASLNETDVARFGDYMYGAFAFHHTETGKVAIRIALTYSYEVARGALTQLGFFLPVPEKLKAPLDEAAANKTLMKDLMPKIGQYE